MSSSRRARARLLRSLGALHLGLLTDLGGRPLLGFGVPNALTLFRGMAGPPLVVVALAHELALAGVIYAVASLSDVVDGFVARRRGPVSRLGVVMDALVDIVWNSSAVLALVLAGILPAWILLAVGVRYGLLLAGSAVLYLVHAGMHIRPTRFGKLTGFFTSMVILLIVGNRLAAGAGGLGAAPSREVESLLEIALGFIIAATIGMPSCSAGSTGERPPTSASASGDASWDGSDERERGPAVRRAGGGARREWAGPPGWPPWLGISAPFGSTIYASCSRSPARPARSSCAPPACAA